MSIQTSCKQCVFAVYEDLTQVDCKQDMLDKYRDNGDSVIDCYDENAEFNVIEGRKCPYQRDTKWASRFSDLATLETVQKVLHLETRLGFNVILYITDFDLAMIEKTVASLTSQSEQPSNVTLVISAKEFSTGLLQTIQTTFLDYKGKWNVRFMKTNEKPRKVGHLINKTTKCQYMVFADSGYEFENDFFKSINDSIIDNLIQFAAIKPTVGSEINGLVIPTTVYEHWYTMGDRDFSIYENIKDYECEQQDNSITTMHQIKLVTNLAS